MDENPDLSGFNIILPGKRPVVFIKKILAENKYSGFVPSFFTIEELVAEISQKQPVQGISLWLFAYSVYQGLDLFPKDDFASFLKWFPTVVKDWDDMLKFSGNDKKVLEYMFDEERIKDWAQDLGEQTEQVPRKKYLNFWKNMNVFLPVLKQKLTEKNWATAGMLHESAKEKIDEFVRSAEKTFVFCGFNAFTPIEEELVRKLLQWDKAKVFFQADAYYMEDDRQEAGKFLREHKKWKEFNKHRNFRWIENDFSKPKAIKVYEVSGNVSQTKLLPEIFEKLKNEQVSDYSDTAVILLDEHLLPATLDAVSSAEKLNITMGFPLKNLDFSNAIKHIFHLQKQLEKKDGSYYFNDVLPILEELPNNGQDSAIISSFKSLIEERNIVYISKKMIQHQLQDLSYFRLIVKPGTTSEFVDFLIDYCYQLKFDVSDDIQYENISHFEKSFRIIRNQITPFDFTIRMETMEVLVNQLIHSETIDFQGEPLQGLQIMGLLETRLLNFKNIILLSVNEGKLPLGNSQNTYIPFDVRKHFNMHTYLENDSIYAYHFYRLLQDSENVHLLYNALSSGVNTGEKSRFITQLEFEDRHHKIEHLIIENSSEPVLQNPVEIPKTKCAIEQLEEWKNRISASHLTTYIYNPIDFYLNKILETKETTEIEEELSVRNYGNLVHYSLQVIYENIINKYLTENDLDISDEKILEAIHIAIVKLKHQPEFYEKGMNYVHKSIAFRVIKNIISYDLSLLRSGHSLKIIGLEKQFENIPFYLDEERKNKVCFFGFIDRIDELDGVLRIIDYKTAKTKELNLKMDDNNIDDYLIKDSRKQALQLCIYNFVVNRLSEYAGREIQTGIWSFAEVNKGVVALEFLKGNLEDAMVSVRNLILEILNPEVPFTESIRPEFENK